MQAAEDVLQASESTRSAVNAVLRTPGAKIELVTVTTAIEPLASEVTSPISDLLGQLNDLEDTEPLAGHTHIAQADLFNSIADSSRPSVDIEMQILDWGRAYEPQRVFYGRVSARTIAQWFQSFGSDLFADNIRVVIPRSDINEGIFNTLKTSPERFFYYNNGITILAERIETGASGMVSREAAFIKLMNASIVNGAQTVSTLGSAVGSAYETQLESAYVIVRCIEVPQDDSELARMITRYANTQNEVSSQDFAFLDENQHRLANELAVMGYEYVLRSAEVPKQRDRTKVIDLRQAAIALACASESVAPAVTAKREVSRLFADNSLYRSLFNPNTDPMRLVQAVRVMEHVDDILDVIEQYSDGVRAGIAVHGRRAIAHVILRELGEPFLIDPQSDLDSRLDDIEERVEQIVQKLVEVFPDNAYPGNVFKNQSRVSYLLSQAEVTH